MKSLTLVFVHGYSVSNLNTYGDLPKTLMLEGEKQGFQIHIQDIYLGRFISFNDEIRLSDIAKALQAAVQSIRKLNKPFVCITHSTGAPLVRTWLNLFYANASSYPISHLIMLAPANHGSALAQLGKSRLSRIKTWFEGVEPGQNILNFLELGSDECWQLNTNWIRQEAQYFVHNSLYPFVISGQDIDRKLYDHLNSYTGEAGTDGVVRLASANLNSTYIKFEQASSEQNSTDLHLIEFLESPSIAFRVLRKKSHSGDEMGILKSIKSPNKSATNKETIDSIFACLNVSSQKDYISICEKFDLETKFIQQESLLEIEQKLFQRHTYFHDRYSMLIFKVYDMENNPISDFDLIFTAGEENDPNALAPGFLCDRQFNRVNKSTLSFYFNYDSMLGLQEIKHEGEVLRPTSKGMKSIGIRIQARPEKGFVRFASAEIKASADLLFKLFKPNATTLVEIRLQRYVSKQTFGFEELNASTELGRDFKHTSEGTDFII